MQAKNRYLNNLKGLDILRFFLSISVILWHYQHFFLRMGQTRDQYLTHQPFYSVLFPFYQKGAMAVQLFWMISGIIFYKVYQNSVYQQKTGFGKFFINRFSRLYPLHLVTLLIVLGLQQYLVQHTGRYFIYQHNDAKYFIYNLFFVQSWGTVQDSFNGPTWSVSIELLVYFGFFFFCLSGLLKNLKNLVLTVLFFLMVKRFDIVFATASISECFLFFFAGCLLIKIITLLQGRQLFSFGLAAATVAVIGFVFVRPPAVRVVYDHLLHGVDVLGLLIGALAISGCMYFFNRKWFDGVNSKYFQFFGDMTYSTYLLHFPLQLLFFILLKPASPEVFNSKIVFLSYMISVFALGRICFLYFERPAQQWLRNRLEAGPGTRFPALSRLWKGRAKETPALANKDGLN